MQNLDVNVETKTFDNVFVNVLVSVQYVVSSDKIYEAFYSLQNAEAQMSSYIFDVVRSKVPTMQLDHVFNNKIDIAEAVKAQLSEKLSSFGFTIVKTLVTDVDPDQDVKAAMNEINASKRRREAMEQQAEADKLLQVKKAEAEAEAKHLQGQGIARQRRAIIDGLRTSVSEIQQGNNKLGPKEVMDLVLMTQYFDTLKELGQTSDKQTLFIGHNPGALSKLADEIKMGVIN